VEVSFPSGGYKESAMRFQGITRYAPVIWWACIALSIVISILGISIAMSGCYSAPPNECNLPFMVDAGDADSLLFTIDAGSDAPQFIVVDAGQDVATDALYVLQTDGAAATCITPGVQYKEIFSAPYGASDGGVLCAPLDSIIVSINGKDVLGTGYDNCESISNVNCSLINGRCNSGNSNFACTRNVALLFSNDGTLAAGFETLTCQSLCVGELCPQEHIVGIGGATSCSATYDILLIEQPPNPCGITCDDSCSCPSGNVCQYFCPSNSKVCLAPGEVNEEGCAPGLSCQDETCTK
jgi:hypothetical protein